VLVGDVRDPRNAQDRARPGDFHIVASAIAISDVDLHILALCDFALDEGEAQRSLVRRHLSMR
jgi:hypothetical protein